MEAAVLLSGFSGLVAAFVASALWATRPTALVSHASTRATDRAQARVNQGR
jgi:hypothetical protein